MSAGGTDRPPPGGTGGETGAAPPRRRHAPPGGWKRVAALVAGSLCILAGVVMGFLPVLQGWVFVGLGIAILAPVFPPARRAMLWAFRRWPRLRRAVPKRFRRRARPGPPAADAEPEGAA